MPNAVAAVVRTPTSYERPKPGGGPCDAVGAGCCCSVFTFVCLATEQPFDAATFCHALAPRRRDKCRDLPRPPQPWPEIGQGRFALTNDSLYPNDRASPAAD